MPINLNFSCYRITPYRSAYIPCDKTRSAYRSRSITLPDETVLYFASVVPFIIVSRVVAILALPICRFSTIRADSDTD
jgi:hypothetical protein